MTTRSTLTFLGCITLCLFASTGMRLAEAGNNMPLDQVGGVCDPDAVTIHAGLYESRGFDIGFSGANTGSVRLMCPFPVSSDRLDSKIGLIFMSVIDADGMEAGTRNLACFFPASTIKINERGRLGNRGQWPCSTAVRPTD